MATSAGCGTGSSTPHHHFVCPISLQPMQDPVTAPTGITYDRRAIERWLAAGHATCPVTGQPLCSLADLTPNHTLRRLITSWNYSSTGTAAAAAAPDDAVAVTPVKPAGDSVVLDAADLVARLVSSTAEECPDADVIREAAAAAAVSCAARRSMVAAGVVRCVLRGLVVSCASARKSSRAVTPAAEECLALMNALDLDVSAEELRPLVADNHDLVDALTHVLVTLDRQHGSDSGVDTVRENAVRLLASVTEVAHTALLERLRPELFRAVTAVVRDRVSPGAARSALRSLLNACPSGKNRALIVEAGAAHEAIELELMATTTTTSRRVTELVMALLAQLCACADGRAAVASHPAGIAVVAKRVQLRASSAASDACAVRVLAAVCGKAASPEVVREMDRVGAVGKLCCVLQAECDAAVKEAARSVLRLHSGVWCGSPCVSAYLLSRFT